VGGVTSDLVSQKVESRTCGTMNYTFYSNVTEMAWGCL